MNANFEDLPLDVRTQILKVVENQLASLSESEKAIVCRSEESLTYYLASVFQSAAKILGYLIVLPIRFAVSQYRTFCSGY